MRNVTYGLIASVAVALLSTPVGATDPPLLLNYQGRLTDTAGNPQTGMFRMTFQIFDAEAAGNPLPSGTPWEETQSVEVIDGIFTVLLGGMTPLPAEANNLDLSNSMADSGLITKDGVRFIHNFGINNTFVGVEAGNFTMTGDENTATGRRALQLNTTGSNNTATGSSALMSNTTGASNTATGRSALFANTTGDANTATGVAALVSNDTGGSNTATGFRALASNTTGGGNTATGTGALSADTSGLFNTATGINALQDNTTGFNNTAIGQRALFSNTGTGNTAIGFTAGENATTGDNNIYVNNSGVAGESNTIRIGTPGVHTDTFVAGIVENTLLAGFAGVRVDLATGRLGITPVISSKRFKEQVRDMGEASTGLMRLRPVSFRYKSEYDGGAGVRQYGLIAEEVAEVLPDLVQYADTGEPYTVRYDSVNAMLLNEVQKQHRMITRQQEEIEHQQGEIGDLSARLVRLEALGQQARR